MSGRSCQFVRYRLFLPALLVMASASAAAAQAPAAAPPRVVAGQDGVVIESADGEFRLAPGLASTGSSRRADAWTAGVNWYMTGNVRHTVNLERTVFDDDPDGPHPPENALVVRTQVSF